MSERSMLHSLGDHNDSFIDLSLPPGEHHLCCVHLCTKYELIRHIDITVPHAVQPCTGPGYGAHDLAAAVSW